jgi:type IV pilus assembly protein PilP
LTQARAPRAAVFAAPGIALAATLAGAALSACGDDEPPPPPPYVPAPPAPQANAAGASGAAAGGAGTPSPAALADAGAPLPDAMPPLPAREFQEADFAETDRSRDPFRSFESLFVTQSKGRVTQQRQVVVERFALDELKLVGVVTRGAARALFTDPTGLGWVIKVGDFIGKPEVVQSGGPSGTEVSINWRVDRIREGDVVFVREDPSHPEIPPATRVIALYPVEDPSAQAAPRRR